jgi:hypothetical protein
MLTAALITFSANAAAQSSAPSSSPSSPAGPVAIGSGRELFIDSRLIDRLNGTRLQLHRPRPAGEAIRFDRPWEGMYCAYATVIKDGDVYRLYYRGHPGGGEDGSDVETTCYAESADGIAWTKPNLGLFEVLGTRENNVILAHHAPFSHNFSPFIDTRPGVPQAERYKALAGINKSGLVAFVSPDGVRWKKLRSDAVFRETVDWVFDSQNVAFWSDAEQCYVLYYRRTLNRIRSVARTTSKDFVSWTEPVQMSFREHPPTLQEQLYTNQTAPYFRAPHIYIATAARFMQGRSAATTEQLAGAEAWRVQDCSDVVLMSTRGGHEYQRAFAEAFVRPGIGVLNWTSRTNYPALGVVPTGENEMSLYVQRRYGDAGHYLERLTLRLDGFVSVNAPYAGGEMVTKPLTSTGKGLEINFATSAAGSVRVEIQTASGEAIPGFALADCSEMVGDEISRAVSWKRGADVSELSGKSIRLRFVMKDADLYSLRFVP